VKFMLRAIAATALMVLAADVCLGATARSSLISKKQETAIRLAHPKEPRGGRHNSVPRNGAARTATAADAQKAGTGAGTGTGTGVGAVAGTGAGAVAVTTRNASIVGAMAVAPAAVAAPALRAPAFSVKPPPVAAVHDAVISGTNVKHSLSTLASVGGAATGSKGTAVVNGTNVRPKKH